MTAADRGGHEARRPHRVRWGRSGRTGRYQRLAALPPAPADAAETTHNDRPGAGRTAWRVDAGAGTRAMRTAGRAVLWLVASVVAVAGLRQIVFPPAAGPVHAGAARAPRWPTGTAQQVATRFAVDYLSWDEDDPSARARALAADVASGVDTTAGWDGNGRQTVTLASAGGLDRRGAARAVVTVQARVVPYTRAGTTAGAAGGWRALPPVWRTVQVPVVLVSGRVSVAGAPAYVGRRRAPAVPAATAPQVDSGLSATTRGQAERFFAAYADGDTTTFTAPAARIAGLGGAVTFVELVTWSVHSGEPEVRDASAVVRWRDVTGAVLAQPYRLRLVRLTAGGASRWFVEQVEADANGGSR